MLANITIITCNRLNLTKKCVESVLALTRGEFCVNIVDNASIDGTWDFLQEASRNDTRLRVTRFARNMGVAVAANYGWALAEHHPYVKLDNDVEILNGDWLEILLEYASANPEIGMAGYQFLPKHKPVEVELSGKMPFLGFETCGGACVLVPAGVHRRLGFWTEDYGKYGFEDLDYGLRCKLAGLVAGYVPYSGRAVHLGYELPETDYENAKRQVVSSDSYGERIFFYNKLMFQHHIRDLHVSRKMLPIAGTDPVRFRTDPAYQPVQRLLGKMRETIPWRRVEDKAELDLSQWKISLGGQ